MFEPSGYPYVTSHKVEIYIEFLSFWQIFLKNATILVSATKLCRNIVAIVANTSPDITGQETVQSCLYL